MVHKETVFGRKNLVICGIAILLIILGFILMSGPSSSIEGFEPDIFSFRRIRLAPVVCLSGFVLMIVGIIYPNKKLREENKNNF